MFTLKQFATIHHQKQLATESGRVKIQTFVDRSGINISKVYTMYIYMCGRSAPHFVCLAVPNR